LAEQADAVDTRPDSLEAKWKRPAKSQQPNVYLEPKWLQCLPIASALTRIRKNWAKQRALRITMPPQPNRVGTVAQWTRRWPWEPESAGPNLGRVSLVRLLLALAAENAEECAADVACKSFREGGGAIYILNKEAGLADLW
jgi:hypothetical protein